MAARESGATSPNPSYYKNLLTFFLTFEEISRIVHNISIGYHVFDSCVDENKAIKNLLQILSGPGKTIPNYSCTNRDKIVGFIGDHYSKTTLPMAQMLSLYRYTQISYGATSHELSNKKLYPKFFRTVQNHQAASVVLCKLIKFFGWTWVGILASKDDAGEKEVHELTNIMASEGICPAFIIKVKQNSLESIQGHERNLEIIRKSSAQILVLCGSNSFSMGSILYYLEQHLSDRTLILYPSWAEQHFLLNDYPKTFNGSLALTSLQSKFPEATDFLKNFQRIKYPNDLLLENIWIMFNQCLTSNPKKNRDITYFFNFSLYNCSREEPITSVPEFNKFPFSTQVFISVYTMISALSTLLSMEQPTNGKNVPIYGIRNQVDSENCIRCADHEWSNEKKDLCVPRPEDFLSYEGEAITVVVMSVSVLCHAKTVFIITIFLLYHDTPIVKANNKSLSFVLLISIMLSFLCVFLFLGRPVDVTCLLRQSAFAILFTIAVSSVLAKTIIVCIAFKATKPGSVWKKWIGVKLPICIVSVCSSVQVIVCISWLVISPPFQELDTHTYQEKIIIQCNEGSVLGFYSVLGYLGVLAAVSFITAFAARTLPDTFNEAKYITFSMLVFCSVWIAMIPAYLSTTGKYTVAVEIFAILASNIGLLGCIFFPKCYIILCKPQLNTKICFSEKKEKRKMLKHSLSPKKFF
ncbi:vomeronasal type-2 receptor 26-like [Mantella aurantiaca]